MKEIVLNNNNKIPCIGLGTWKMTDRNNLNGIIGKAYELGYRLFDTAAAYGNEIGIGKAILSNNINRQDLFITDKVWNTYRGYNAVREACIKSLKKLKTDYLDLYLIHWPASMKLYPDWEEINAETWRGMERVYEEGLVRNIGVCNFKIHHLEALKKSLRIIPVINQIELHPGFSQDEILRYCKAEGIIVEASSPLGSGIILQNEAINLLAKEKNISSAQLILRWIYQKGVISIPKSSRTEGLVQNINIFDFELSDEEMTIINGIPYCGGLGLDPDEVTQFG